MLIELQIPFSFFVGAYCNTPLHPGYYPIFLFDKMFIFRVIFYLKM